MAKIIVIRKDAAGIFHGKPYGDNAKTFSGRTKAIVISECTKFGNGKNFSWFHVKDYEIKLMKERFPLTHIVQAKKTLKVPNRVNFKHGVLIKDLLSNIRTKCKEQRKSIENGDIIAAVIRYAMEYYNLEELMTKYPISHKEKTTHTFANVGDYEYDYLNNLVTDYETTITTAMNCFLKELCNDPDGRIRVILSILNNGGE